MSKRKQAYPTSSSPWGLSSLSSSSPLSSSSSSSMTTGFSLAQGGNRSFAGRPLFIGSSEEPESPQNFWSILARKAKAAIMDDNPPASGCSEPVATAWKQQEPELQPSLRCRTKPRFKGRQRQGEAAPVFQKGYEAITSSLSSLGNAIEEGLNLVETKASGLMSSDSRLLSIKKKVKTVVQRQRHGADFVDPENSLTYETQLKASRDVSMAMATKAKLLIRELKTLKVELAFTKDSCSQLEEENNRLRESLENGIGPEEEDLVRAELEKLLREKSKLSQENSSYARENQFLREVVEYHQLTREDVILLDESNLETATEIANDSGFEEEAKDDPPEKVISVIAN